MGGIHSSAFDDLSVLLHLTSPLVPYEDDHGPVVVVLVAVVRSGKDSQKLPGGEVLVAMLHALVRAYDELQAVPAVELLHPVGAESARVLPTRRHVHAQDLVVVCRIAPESVKYDAIPPRGARRDLPGDLNGFRDAAQVIQRADAVPDAAVYAEDGVVDQRRDGQKLEDIIHPLPHELSLMVEHPKAVLVETVVDVHQAVLVVAPH
mmetsp:Transcript_134835/g.336425  ORF Transcript_134835/g.336425 Transcript_134835/m.336425 type:complete len:206 (-) Transcript_134835:369-986(-)